MTHILLRNQNKTESVVGTTVEGLFAVHLAKCAMALRVAAKIAAHFVEALDRSVNYALRASPPGSTIFGTQQNFRGGY